MEIVNEVPEDLVLHTDRHRLLEIILNLMINAQESIDAHAPDIGRITVSTKLFADGQKVALRITDNGSGIREQDQPQIFTHGFTTKPTGHGFGLHSSANAAKTLGGDLSLESPGPGQGATATLFLPLQLPA